MFKVRQAEVQYRQVLGTGCLQVRQAKVQYRQTLEQDVYRLDKQRYRHAGTRERMPWPGQTGGIFFQILPKLCKTLALCVRITVLLSVMSA